VFSGEQCADALNEVLDHPRKAKRLFARYERAVNRAMDVYLRFVNAWYTKEFIEVFLAPRNVLGLAPAVNAVLGGNVGSSFRKIFPTTSTRLNTAMANATFTSNSRLTNRSISFMVGVSRTPFHPARAANCQWLSDFRRGYAVL
jgi:hypothetical protein